MIPLANTLANFPLCLATVAIDLPLHGVASTDAVAPAIFAGYNIGGVRERTFGADYMLSSGAPGQDSVPDASGAHFINLTSPLTSRDNLRQAAADMLALSRSLTAMDYNGGGQDFDAARVYFVGHSLGAITGSNFVSYDPRVKASVLVAPGGGLAKMVPSSPAFGPTINAGLAAAGRAVGSAGYEDFLFLLQTVIDQGDPLGNWEAFRAKSAPSIMLQMGGDLVVPNDSASLPYMVRDPQSGLPISSGVAANAPYAGTTPLARAFGLNNISASTVNTNGVSGLVRYTVGCHSSLLSTATCPPVVSSSSDAQAITVEINTLIATYLASNGTSVVFTDPNRYVR